MRKQLRRLFLCSASPTFDIDWRMGTAHQLGDILTAYGAKGITVLGGGPAHGERLASICYPSPVAPNVK